MSRRPSKQEVLQILDTAPDRISAIKKDVRWATNLGTSPKVRPTLRVSGGPGHGDSTGSVVLGQERTRERVKNVYSLVGELRDCLNNIDAALATLFERADSRKDYAADEITGEHSKKPRKADRLVTKAELDRAREAQAERTRRGEGYGAG